MFYSAIFNDQILFSIELKNEIEIVLTAPNDANNARILNEVSVNIRDDEEKPVSVIVKEPVSITGFLRLLEVLKGLPRGFSQGNPSVLSDIIHRSVLNIDLERNKK